MFIPLNAVHSCILNALHLQDMQVTMRALGILGKLITGPWMRLPGVETTILGMNKHFQAALGNITAWSNDASSLIQLNAPCAFSCVDVKRDTVFHSLVDRTDFNRIYAETRPPVLWTGKTHCGRVLICLDG